MKNRRAYIQQYPHGFNDGFTYTDGKTPPITTSSWAFNNFVVIYETEDIADKFTDEPDQ